MTNRKARKMRIPVIRGIIDRRVLVNYRVDPIVLSRVCPPPFRPQLVNGFGIAGICLIRLKHIRPKFLPPWVGISSENAAHRIAVEWDVQGHTQAGVYIPRRDTSSRLNALVGGRLFPGVHHHAKFDIRESGDAYHIAMDSDDGTANISVDGRITDGLSNDSVFQSVTECSNFFEAGSLGYSPANSASQFDGLELRTDQWQVQSLDVSTIQSSFFDERAIFPVGSVAFDNALLMRGIEHEWHSRESLYCSKG